MWAEDGFPGEHVVPVLVLVVAAEGRVVVEELVEADAKRVDVDLFVVVAVWAGGYLRRTTSGAM
jgi:hypothetical protein